MQVPVEVVKALDPEEPALPGRVGRLEHGRHAHSLQRRVGLVQVACGCEPRLRDASLGEPASLRDLVRHQVRRLRSHPGEPELLRHRGNDRNGPLGRERDDALDAVPPAELDDGAKVAEVDDLRYVGLRETDGVGVSVDRHHLETELVSALDDAALVAPRADEQDPAQLTSRRTPS